MQNWLDRLTMPLAPRWTSRRVRARMAMEVVQRSYEAASISRRTQGWTRFSGDANAAAFAGLARIREQARDMVRNNSWAESALSSIVDNAIGWGIVGGPRDGMTSRAGKQTAELWKRWAETKACDADGRQDFYGLQKQVMRTTVEAGEALVRRRWRLPKDNLPVPMQLQILEPDFLDTSKDGMVLDNGGRIIQGVEFDAIGRRAGYWMFRDHPGANLVSTGTFGSASVRIDASEILAIYRNTRPGQVRGVSWFAPGVLTLKDLDEYEDAALVKQKIAACLAVFINDIEGNTSPLGAISTERPEIDSLEPGMIVRNGAGRDVEVVNPPTVSELGPYAQTVLRKVAAGLGLAYEDLTGNYETLSFSAARMSRIRAWARVHDWRWQMVIPQFCDPVWSWFVEAAGIIPGIVAAPIAKWTPPPMPMIEPDKEGLAIQRNVRGLILTPSEALREQGYDPDEFFAEYAADWKKIHALGIITDADSSKMTQAGQLHGTGAAPGSDAAPPPTVPAASNGNGNGSRSYDRDSWAADTVEGALALARTALELAERRYARNGHDREPIHVETPVTVNNHPAPPAEVRVEGSTVNVTTPPVNINEGAVQVDAQTVIARGAVQAHVEAAPAPNVTVNTPITVEPTEVTIAKGAMSVEIAPPPPADIHVAAPTVNVAPAVVNVAEGAIQVDIAPPPPAQVRVEAPVVNVTTPPVTIEEGAVHVEAPVRITTPAPTEAAGPTRFEREGGDPNGKIIAIVDARGVRKRVLRDANNRITGTTLEPEGA